MTVSRETQLYCLKCGHVASMLVPSMDPGHPLVTCLRTDGGGRAFGCGRQLGTYDVDEAEAAADLDKTHRAAAKHERHVLDKRRNPTCPLCRRSDLEREPLPHPFERIDNKHRLAQHLDRYHAQGDGVTMVVQVRITELFELHRSLHERATVAVPA